LTATTLRALLLYGLSCLFLILPFTVSTGFFTIDEVVYFLSVYAFHTEQSFLVDNGAEILASEDLAMLKLLVSVPEGFTPQYPGGFAVLGALFYEVFGARGLILLNSLAAIGTLFVTHMLALRLFNSMNVANLAVALLAIFSFMPEYAAGYWPHMVSVLSVTLSLYFFLRALDPEAPFWWAFASGLVLGCGLLFRVDGLLLLSAIALVTAVYGNNPVYIFAGGVLGLIPALAISSGINAIKFGTLNPISYGTSGGNGADPTTYLAFALVAGLATIAIWGIRLRGGLPRVWIIGMAVAILGAVFILPQAERLMQLMVRGVLALMIDSKTIIDTRPGVHPGPDGTIFFWGLSKKALGQSLPWLGLISALVILPTAAKRRSILIVLIFVVLWSLPFILRSWHGGLGSNMRYLLPTLPALAALVAWIIIEIAQRLERPMRSITVGALAAFGLVNLWMNFVGSGSIGVQQILSTYVLAAVVILVWIGLLVDKLRPAAGMAVGLALAMAFVNGVSDQLNGQIRRIRTQDLSLSFTAIKDPVVIYGAPESVVYAPAKTKAIAAIIPFNNATYDRAFLEAAIATSHRVLMPNGMLSLLNPDVEVLKPRPADVPTTHSEIVVAQ